MTQLLAPRPHIILIIGDDGIVTVPHNIQNPAPFFTPHDSKNGAQEIISYVARHPTAKITLLADNLAQDYRSDSLPRLNLFDRMKLIQRRLKQSFPSARLTASLCFKQSHHQVLLIGLHESNTAFVWAERLRERMPTISLLPVEGAVLFSRLMPEIKNGWAMSISRHQSGGFRQIVTLNGDLVFTRLTPLPPKDSRDDDAEIIARDIKASLDYLTRHGLRKAADLSVLLLLPDDIHTGDCFTSLSLKSISSLAPFAAAQRLGFPFAPQPHDDAGDLLFAAQIAAHRPTLSLMLPDTQQAKQTQNLQQWGLRVASVALFLAVIHMIVSASGLVSTIAATEKQVAQLEQTRQQLVQAQASAAPLTEPLGRLRQAVERRRIYDMPTPTPWQGLNELSGGLDENAKITRVDWKKDSDTAPESFTVALRVTSQTTDDARAETVAAFTQTTQNIAQAMPDYTLAVTHTPYPDLPQDSVTAATTTTDPIGDITLQRKMP